MKADRDANFIANNAEGKVVNRWTSTGMLCASASSNETGCYCQIASLSLQRIQPALPYCASTNSCILDPGTSGSNVRLRTEPYSRKCYLNRPPTDLAKNMAYNVTHCGQYRIHQNAQKLSAIVCVK
jgi:hypothetical protein